MAQIGNLEVELTVLVGTAKLPLQRLLRMGRGAVIPLGGDETKSLEILANGRKIAQGRVLLDGDNVTVEVTAPDQAAA